MPDANGTTETQRAMCGGSTTDSTPTTVRSEAELPQKGDQRKDLRRTSIL